MKFLEFSAFFFLLFNASQLKGLILLGERSWLSCLISICSGGCIKFLMGSVVVCKFAWDFYNHTRQWFFTPAFVHLSFSVPCATDFSCSALCFCSYFSVQQIIDVYFLTFWLKKIWSILNFSYQVICAQCQRLKRRYCCLMRSLLTWMLSQEWIYSTFLRKSVIKYVTYSVIYHFLNHHSL